MWMAMPSRAVHARDVCNERVRRRAPLHRVDGLNRRRLERMRKAAAGLGQPAAAARILDTLWETRGDGSGFRTATP